MSYLRAGRGGENRRSVFYTGNNLSSSAEEWELVDPPSKDFPEQKNPSEAHRSMSAPRSVFCPRCGIKLFRSDETERRGGSTRREKSSLSFLYLCIKAIVASYLASKRKSEYYNNYYNNNNGVVINLPSNKLDSIEFLLYKFEPTHRGQM